MHPFSGSRNQPGNRFLTTETTPRIKKGHPTDSHAGWHALCPGLASSTAPSQRAPRSPEREPGHEAVRTSARGHPTRPAGLAPPMALLFAWLGKTCPGGFGQLSAREARGWGTTWPKVKTLSQGRAWLGLSEAGRTHSLTGRVWAEGTCTSEGES